MLSLATQFVKYFTEPPVTFEENRPERVESVGNVGEHTPRTRSQLSQVLGKYRVPLVV